MRYLVALKTEKSVEIHWSGKKVLLRGGLAAGYDKG